MSHWPIFDFHLGEALPLGIYVILAVSIYCLFRVELARRYVWTIPVAAWFAGTGALLWLALTFYYLGRPFLIDHVEANLASVAWGYHHGLPLYHDLASSDRYGLIYGPLSFLANTVVLCLFGPSMLSAKILGPATALASVGLTFHLCRRWTNARRACLLAALLCTSFLDHTFYTMSNRPDGLMTFLVAAALVGARPTLEMGTTSAARALLIGACAGLAMSCKLHGFVYFIPILGALLATRALRAALVASFAALATFAAFFLLDNVSAHHYLRLMQIAAHHPLVWRDFIEIFTWQALVALPLLLAVRRLPAEDRPGRGFAMGLMVASVLLLGFGSKAGAGRHHVLPMLPSYGALLAWYWRQGVAWPRPSRALCAAGMLVAMGFGVEVATEMVARGQAMPAREVMAELDHLYVTLPAKDGMVGYSKSYDFANFRVLNVFAGARPFIEGAAEIDFHAAHQRPSAAVFERLRRCPYAYWLIRKGEEPFSEPDRDETQSAFDPRFRSTFLAAYRKTSSLQYYDIWTCRVSPPALAGLTSARVP